MELQRLLECHDRSNNSMTQTKNRGVEGRSAARVVKFQNLLKGHDSGGKESERERERAREREREREREVAGTDTPRKGPAGKL